MRMRLLDRLAIRWLSRTMPPRPAGARDPDEWDRVWPVPSDEGADSVAIVAFGDGWQNAPYGMPGWEIWGFNDVPRRPPLHCFSRWFQLHSPAYCERFYPSGLRVLREQWGERRGVPLYMDRAYAEYPDSRPFPKAELDQMGPHGGYHASSLDWLLAYAAWCGFQRIAFFGLHLYGAPLLNGEPLSGRACFEYWAGYAEARGAVVEVEQDRVPVHLFKTVHAAIRIGDEPYGFGREPGLELKEDGEWIDLR